MQNSFPKHDLAAVNRFILLPVQPLNASYQTEKLGIGRNDNIGPSDWGIAIYLEYEESTYQNLLAMFDDKNKLRKPSISRKFLFNWLPASVKKQFIEFNTSHYTWSGDAYSLADNAKEPLLNGFIAVDKKNKGLFLYLYTN